MARKGKPELEIPGKEKRAYSYFPSALQRNNRR
jgi:hypothetical protein